MNGCLEQSLPTTLLTDLLSDLGVQHQVNASSEDIWVRRLVTKNGLQDWVIAFNAGRGTVEGVALRLPRPRARRGSSMLCLAKRSSSSGTAGRSGSRLCRSRAVRYACWLWTILSRWRPWLIGSRRSVATNNGQQTSSRRQNPPPDCHRDHVSRVSLPDGRRRRPGNTGLA